MDGAPDPSDFWAKLKYKDDDPSTGEIVAWHPLLAHSADVAAVTEALLQRTILRDRLASLIGWDELSDVHVARLSALAALHDAGKVNHGFQDQAFSETGRSPGHVQPMVELIDAGSETSVRCLRLMDVPAILDWFPQGADRQTLLFRFLQATFGHHGTPVCPKGDFRKDRWLANERRDPMRFFETLAAQLRQWFPQAFENGAKPFPKDPALQHVFNGVLTLADWLGSDRRYFDYATDLDGYVERARSNAAEAIDTNFLDPSSPRQDLGSSPVGFDGVLEEDEWNPYDIQQAVLEAPLHENGSLTVLESDTGSGKTEAAIARFVRLYQAGLVDGMYFAVPTRSAATQLYDRVADATERVFARRDGTPPTVVQAVPGYLKADAVEGVPLPSFDVQWPDDPDDAKRERRWAAEHPKRYLAGAIIVGTVDQVLLSTLQVRHAHMRASALLRHFLVVDEIHASDAYMAHLLDRVLDQHLAAGGHALLMSATLGTATRVRLTTDGEGEPPGPEGAEDVDYPLVTHVDASRTDPTTRHEASSGTEKTVIPEPRPLAGGPGAVASLAAERAQEGARVLVIRNRVADCIDTQQALEEEIDDPMLLFGVDGTAVPHHSRFAPDDRQALDNRIETVFGEADKSDQSSRVDDGGIVAVATQTVEQSLDIDADLMITDLCPIDVLLQRIGRLHRHDRDRPAGVETARCVILTPAERDLGGAITDDGKGWEGDYGLGTVYEDLRVLEATWQILEDEDAAPWHIPADNRTLVERGTHPTRLRRIIEDPERGTRWKKHQQFILGQKIADRQTAGLVTIDRSEDFGLDEFDGDLKTVKTRLGRDDYHVDLPEPMDGPFESEVEEVTVTEWQVDEEPEDLEAEDAESIDGGFRFVFEDRPFRYDRFGLAPTSNS
jgi:CRISPR-associated endonuclease/helicase Cas3